MARYTGKMYPDVTADGTDPDLLALETEGRKPQPQVVALMDGASGLLQRDVLLALE